jgi:hypothetical protein
VEKGVVGITDVQFVIAGRQLLLLLLLLRAAPACWLRSDHAARLCRGCSCGLTHAQHLCATHSNAGLAALQREDSAADAWHRKLSADSSSDASASFSSRHVDHQTRVVPHQQQVAALPVSVQPCACGSRLLVVVVLLTPRWKGGSRLTAKPTERASEARVVTSR